ncbi:hypothetical protein ACNOYE_23655 [Nannocystaceae bacterium ST9]
MSKPPTSAVRLAVLDESAAAQLRASSEHASDLEVVWHGTSLAALRKAAPELEIDVLLVNLELLGADPVAAIDEMVQLTGAELAITLYAFAKRELLERLADGPRVRALRAPVNLPQLRSQMMNIIARNILGSGASQTGGLTPARYTHAQLGKLQQIASKVECECPNHLSALLQSLLDFERYSRNCENRNPADAEVHRLLFESTARARAIMERALDRLIEHEGIVLT